MVTNRDADQVVNRKSSGRGSFLETCQGLQDYSHRMLKASSATEKLLTSGLVPDIPPRPQARSFSSEGSLGESYINCPEDIEKKIDTQKLEQP